MTRADVAPASATAVSSTLPGPRRAARRNLLLGVVGVAALLAVAGFIVYRFVVTGQFDPDMWEWSSTRTSSCCSSTAC